MLVVFSLSILFINKIASFCAFFVHLLMHSVASGTKDINTLKVFGTYNQTGLPERLFNSTTVLFFNLSCTIHVTLPNIPPFSSSSFLLSSLHPPPPCISAQSTNCSYCFLLDLCLYFNWSMPFCTQCDFYVNISLDIVGVPIFKLYDHVASFCPIMVSFPCSPSSFTDLGCCLFCPNQRISTYQAECAVCCFVLLSCSILEIQFLVV